MTSGGRLFPFALATATFLVTSCSSPDPVQDAYQECISQTIRDADRYSDSVPEVSRDSFPAIENVDVERINDSLAFSTRVEGALWSCYAAPDGTFVIGFG